MFPINVGERSGGSMDNSAGHRPIPNNGKLFVGLGPVNDENLQNIRIQMAVNRYNCPNSPPFRQFSPSAYRCSAMKAKRSLIEGNLTSESPDSSNNIASILYSRHRQRLLRKPSVKSNDNSVRENSGSESMSYMTYADQRLLKKPCNVVLKPSEKTPVAETKPDTSPELRYTGPEQFPTCLIQNGNNEAVKKHNILHQLQSQHAGLPITRYMDDAAEKYSDLKSTRSVLDVLQDLSRKRIHGKDVPEEPKRRCKGLGGDVTQDGEVLYKPLFIPKGKAVSNPKRDQTTQTTEPASAENASTASSVRDPKLELRRKLARRNNEILASLSSSINCVRLTKRRASEASCDQEKPLDNHSSKKQKLNKEKGSDSKEIEDETLLKDKPSKDPSSPKSPDTKDRLMTIYLDLQDSKDAKVNAIKSMLESPGDKQFSRQEIEGTNVENNDSPTTHILNIERSSESKKIEVSSLKGEYSSGFTAPVTKVISTPLSKSAVLDPVTSPIISFETNTSATTTSEKTNLPNTVTSTIASAIPKTPTTQIVTESSTLVTSTISPSVPISSKETLTFSFGLNTVTSPASAAATVLKAPVTSTSASSVITPASAVLASPEKSSESKPFSFGVSQSSFSPAVSSKEVPASWPSGGAPFKLKEVTSPSTTVTSPPAILFNSLPTSIAPATTSSLSTVSTHVAADNKTIFSFGTSSFNFEAKPSTSTTALSFKQNTDQPDSSKSISKPIEFSFGITNAATTTTSSSSGSLSTGGFSLGTSSKTEVGNKPWPNTEVKWSFGSSIPSVASTQSTIADASGTSSKTIFGVSPLVPPSSKPVLPVTSSISAFTTPSTTTNSTADITTTTTTSSSSVFSRLGQPTNNAPFMFGTQKVEFKAPSTPAGTKEQPKQPTNTFVFGTAKPLDQNSSVFGKPTASVFGQVQAIPTASTTSTFVQSFGTPRMTTSALQSSFSTVTTTNTTTTNPISGFGGGASTSAFSATNTSVSSPPTATPTTSSTFIQTASPAGSSLFGQPNAPFGSSSQNKTNSFSRETGVNNAVFSFGSTPSTSKPSVFGQSTVPTFSFGSSASSNAFQQATVSPPTTTASAPSHAQTTSSFGSINSTNPPFGSSFATTNAFVQPAEKSLFDQTATFSSTSTSGFGTNNQFGSTTSATTTSNFTFGKTTSAGTAAPFSFGATQVSGFNSTPPAFPTVSSSTFGAPPASTTPSPFTSPAITTQSTPSPFMFGGSQSTKPVFNFGASATTQPQSSGFNFGGGNNSTGFNFSANSNATSPSSGFSFSGSGNTPGSAAFNQTSTPGAFNQLGTTTPSFGQTPPPNNGGMLIPFGQSPTPSPGGLLTPFGQTPPGAFTVPGTFSIGTGSTSRKRGVRPRRK